MHRFNYPRLAAGRVALRWPGPRGGRRGGDAVARLPRGLVVGPCRPRPAPPGRPSETQKLADFITATEKRFVAVAVQLDLIETRLDRIEDGQTRIRNDLGLLKGGHTPSRAHRRGPRP